MTDQEFLAELPLQAGNFIEQHGRVVVNVEDTAHQRESVGVDSAGREPQDTVSVVDGIRAKQGLVFGDTDDESGEVEVAAGIEPGHLGGLAADQGAPHFLTPPDDAPHEGFHALFIQIAEGNVVEEEEGLGSLGENVIDVKGN